MSDPLQPQDCTIHGILQARILEWVAIPFSGDCPSPGIEPRSPILQADSLPAELQGKPQGKSRGRLISTSCGSDEINYPRAERMKTGDNSAASHLCNCPALVTVYLSWLLITFPDHMQKISFE